ncbi:MAG: hypothetical protein ABS81_12090 [Pseudonocardia sp. SCN 72-86]|nr:MAG: hypothetical protein ABS81_12090 [Pseudonocardia sp. SCN 72-86]
MPTPRDARTVLRTDAAVEAALTLACLAVARTRPTGAWALPHTVSRPVALGMAGILAVAAAALAWLADRADRAVLQALAGANGLTAVATLAWAARGTGLGGAMRVALVGVAVALAGLSGTQLRLALASPEVRAD